MFSPYARMGYGYSYNGPTAGGLAAVAILALVATVLLYIFIVPEKKRPTLNGFGKWLHDFLNVKTLWIEAVLKFIYVFVSILYIIGGFYLMFTVNFLAGLLTAIFAPIINRLLFEAVFMMILLTKNVIQINNRLAGKGDSDPFTTKTAEDIVNKMAAQAQNLYQQPQAPAPQAMPQMQPQPQAQAVCPNCGQPVANGSAFCVYCGTRFQ